MSPSALEVTCDRSARIALRVGDRVRYIGNFHPTFEACGGEPLEVLGFAGGAICASQQRFAIACSTSTGKLIWIYPEDLERIG